jgi:ubiquinone/menaquinone biosynthesis C-methylase UbiE
VNIQIAKNLMKMMESFPPSPENEVNGLQEVFNHEMFINGSVEERKAIMLKSSLYKYDEERAYPVEHYFGTDLSQYLYGKDLLDLGCFNGGRGIAWAERYQLGTLYGIDVDQVYIDAATQFAAIKNVNAKFRVAKGELLPFDDNSLDAIMSFDVFEHLRDVSRTLSECYRVLKKGGRLFVVFPSFYQPIEHHLSLGTRLPCVHYLFSGQTLLDAYRAILDERGSKSDWYRRRNPKLEDWEKGNTINGTTFHLFERYLRECDWKILFTGRKPIGSVGRNISKNKIVSAVSSLFYPLTFLPGLKEVFLHRVVFILEK